MRRSLRFGGAALLTCAASALADDAPQSDAPDEQPTLRGEIRAGMRLLSGEREGRFPQDVALKDGPRLFDLDVVGTDPRRGAPVDEMETRLSGVGDANSDYLMSLKKRGVFDLSGGYRRDAYDYRSTGDPFPYDSVRERGFVHGLWTPSGDAAVRFAWDRNGRRGDALTEGNGPQAVATSEPRSFTDASDRFTLGGDYAFSVFRFGVTQSVGISGIHETRAFDALNTAELSERTNSYATSAKAGVSLFDGALDATLFVTRTVAPMDERTVFVAGNSTDATSGGLRREAMNWRFETTWRPADRWEFTFAGEQDDVVDEEKGFDVVTVRIPGRKPTTFKPTTFVDARITDRERRWSTDATWDASKKLRLRLGEQYLREELVVPTDSHFTSFGENATTYRETDLASDSFRTTAGADWRPSTAMSLSALAHVSSNDAPQTTTVPRNSDEWTARAKWKPLRVDGAPSDDLVLTTLWRRQVLGHSGAVEFADIRNPLATTRPQGTTDLDSTSRTSTVSQSVAWKIGDWTVRGTGTFRRFDTATDSAFYSKRDGVNALEYVSFRGRDVTADLDVRYKILETLRVFADVVRTDARDKSNTRTSTKTAHGVSNASFTAGTLDASVGAECDFGRDVKTDDEVRRNMTLGLKLSTWRRTDVASPQDSCRVYGIELSLTYRF